MKLSKRACFNIFARTFVATVLIAACLTEASASSNSAYPAYPAWIAIAGSILIGAGTFMVALANEHLKAEITAYTRRAQGAFRSAEENVDYDATTGPFSPPRFNRFLFRTGLTLSAASLVLVVGGLIYALTK